MSLSSIEAAAVAAIKADIAKLSVEAQAEIGVVKSWASNNIEVVALIAFVIGVIVKVIF